ncbi:MAG: hypothetical protein VX730_02400 [Pseudomonadota bacterium]|nr:hypothetical protein [Pseudomonadota bacterium]
MTLNTYILWKENNQTHARFPEGDTRPLEKKESLNISGSGRRAVFMAPSADFIRRSHPKPFGEMAKLYKILPGMLHQSLFKKTKLRSLIVPAALQKGQFSSFSLEEEQLQAFVNEAGAHISPVVHVVPMAMGAMHYATGKTHSIVVAPEGEGVTVSLFTPEKQLIEFRHIAKKAPLPDIKQTLQAWTANLKDVTVVNLTTRKVTAPEGAELKTVKTEESPLVHGFYHALTEGEKSPMLNVWDPNSIKALTALSQGLKWPLRVAIVSGLILVALQTAISMKIERSNAAYDGAIETVFNEALPDTPMVEAPLQMSRRANELAVMTGTVVGREDVLLENLLAFQNNVNASELTLTLERFQLSGTSLSMNGAVAGLSQVDMLETIVEESFPEWDASVKDVKLNAGGKATFILTANVDQES